MSKLLKFYLIVCIGAVLLGGSLFISAAAQAEPIAPTTISATIYPDNGEPSVTNVTESKQPDNLSPYLGPGGVVTLAIGGIFLIVREIKATRSMSVQEYKDRAHTAESTSALETQKLQSQINRLEQKLDEALKETEAKHDLWLAEVAHRRKLEVLLAEHGIKISLGPDSLSES